MAPASQRAALAAAALALAAVAGLAFALGAAATASAHVVLVRSSLRQWLQHSEASLHVEVLAGPEVRVAASGDRQEVFRARVIETLAGEGPGPGEVVFFPHAEGFPDFRPGGRHLLFLERTADRPEFAAWAGPLPWFSVQGAGDEWPLEGEDDPALALARGLAGWLADGGADVGRFADLLARGLASEREALQADAWSELVRAQELPGLLDAEGTARFAGLLAQPTLPISRRAALLLLLAGRPGFDADAAFTKLAGEARTPEVRARLARQLGAADLAPVAPWLAEQARDPDPAVRRAAVEAQLRRGERADLDLLARALGDPSDGVARAAVRALGGLPGARARTLLEGVAAGADPERARWAAAELRRAHASDSD